MFNLGLSDNELEERVTGLGPTVLSSCATVRYLPRASAISSLLSAFHSPAGISFLVKPDIFVSTKEAYARIIPETRNAYHRHHPPPRRGMERPPDERFRRRSLCPPSRNRRHQGTAVRPGSGIRIHERFGFERFRPFPDGTGRNGYAQAFPGKLLFPGLALGEHPFLTTSFTISR